MFWQSKKNRYWLSLNYSGISRIVRFGTVNSFYLHFELVFANIFNFGNWIASKNICLYRMKKF